jgi:hypothetical protein
MTNMKEQTTILPFQVDPWVTSSMDNILQGMQALVQNGKEVVPQIILLAYENGARAIVPLVGVAHFFESKESQRQLHAIVKKSWQQISAQRPALRLVAVLLLSDAWVEEVSDKEFETIMRQGRQVPFAPKPGMAEALIVQVSLAEVEVVQEWCYVRGDKEVVFADKPRNSLNSESGPMALLMGMWPL